MHRFLSRVYRLLTEQPLSDAPTSADQLRLLHATIKRVTEETEEMRFNTAIAGGAGWRLPQEPHWNVGT